MMVRQFTTIAALTFCLIGGGATTLLAEVKVSPTSIQLDRPEASQQLIVTEQQGDSRRDLTRESAFEVQTPEIIKVDADGLVHPLAEGNTKLIIRSGSATVEVPVNVIGLNSPPPVSFEYEIQPLLTKGRCNSGGCHGKAEGQNGFKLSLLGFDAPYDHEAIVKLGRGRRITVADPARSLLIQKACAELPHGGGLKIDPGSAGHKRLIRWIGAGAPLEVPDHEPVVSIEIEPAQLVMQAGQTQQLRVTAIDAKGGRQCATAEADFISNAPHVIAADSRGILHATEIPGEAAILVRYLGHVAICQVVLPRPGVKVTRPPEQNFIDQLAWNKLERLGIPPSELADDATFLRRVYLDTIGTLPTAAEARRFLTDPSPTKRSALINEVLNRPEYADYWAMKWSDLLRADKIKITPQGAVGLTRWLRKQFTQNRPYDEMVREIITAQGPVQSESPAAFYKALDQPEVASRAVSQLFLGVRIECAQCHHHPSERWSQDDYVGLAGFFTGLAVKKLPETTDAIVAKAGTDLKHPRTAQLVPARALGAPSADFTHVTDRRQVLAAWMTAPDNPFFARAIANRIWAHYLGRGLVEPIDDMRATNPPTNEALMSALASHLREVKYDLRVFTKTILNSRVYQLSSVASDANRDDSQHFSHAAPKALPAEVLLDAVCQVTGSPEKFNGWPLGVRSIQVWDNRMPSYFFRIFGRPARTTVCECERSNEPSISQALHLLNSPEINAKIGSREGVARKLADSALSPDQIIDEVYLGTVTRFPNAEERTLMQEAFTAAGSNRRQAVEDVLWAVLNTKDFLYNQ